MNEYSLAKVQNLSKRDLLEREECGCFKTAETKRQCRFPICCRPAYSVWRSQLLLQS